MIVFHVDNIRFSKEIIWVVAKVKTLKLKKNC